ncbi:MAG: DUF433 domain-containing protein [Solirubrobacterales bacterium]|nr:DUF433 domain-containing protein [Solirubrobacterales bacterium]
MDPRGAYTAKRAAALSGVPKSTVHYWAREQILVPGVSSVRVKLWSYSDLLALRIIAWLRASKTAPDGHTVPATAMRAVRTALRELSALDLALWTEEGSPNVAVDRGGRIVIDAEPSPEHPDGQAVLGVAALELLRPLEIGRQVRGPDLFSPRPRLRILPGKLSGAPHVHRTRIETEALAALRRRGFTAERIKDLYPAIELADIEQALDLERELQPDLAAAA